MVIQYRPASLDVESSSYCHLEVAVVAASFAAASNVGAAVVFVKEIAAAGVSCQEPPVVCLPFVEKTWHSWQLCKIETLLETNILSNYLV